MRNINQLMSICKPLFQPNLKWISLFLLDLGSATKQAMPRAVKSGIMKSRQFDTISHLPLPARSPATYHLPDLHDIIFWYRTNYPGFIGIPGEVRYLCSMTTMDKLVLGKQKGECFQIYIAEMNNGSKQAMRFKRHTNSSGGPSSASSGDCSSPILL